MGYIPNKKKNVCALSKIQISLGILHFYLPKTNFPKMNFHGISSSDHVEMDVTRRLFVSLRSFLQSQAHGTYDSRWEAVSLYLEHSNVLWNVSGLPRKGWVYFSFFCPSQHPVPRGIRTEPGQCFGMRFPHGKYLRSFETSRGRVQSSVVVNYTFVNNANPHCEQKPFIPMWKPSITSAAVAD